MLFRERKKNNNNWSLKLKLKNNGAIRVEEKLLNRQIHLGGRTFREGVVAEKTVKKREGAPLKKEEID